MGGAVIRRVAVFFVVWSALTSSALGSGYGIFVQGASALGQADAVVAHADGPSALFFNPALMARLPGTQVEAGTTLVVPEREYTAPDGETTEGDSQFFTPATFYLTHAISDRLSAGLAVFSPFGLGTEWPDDWAGRYLATESTITTVNVNPSLAYTVVPGLTVAAGIDLVYLDATLERKVNSTAVAAGLANLGLIPPQGVLADSNQKFTGSGYGVGYNLGLLLDLTKNLTFGISYRSEVEVEAEGELEFELSSPVLAGVFPKSDAESTVTLPQQLFAGLAWQVTDDWVVEGGVRWEDWTAFPRLKVDLEQEVAGTRTFVQERDWDDTLTWMAGTRYRASDRVALLAGYLYSPEAIPDHTFEPAIPGSDSHLFSAGADLSFDRLTVSLAYGLQLYEERTKDNAVGDPATAQAGIVSDTANGDYDSTLHLAAVSVTYRF